MLKQIVSIVAAFVLTDCSPAQREVAASGRATEPSPVELTYLGVAGWQVVHAGHTLLIDPYFTRAPVEDQAAPLRPDPEALARFAPEHADVILVGHSHYDHLLDVAPLARSTGALVVGSESTLNVERASGIPEAQLRLAEPGRALSVQSFSIRPLKSLHSLIGLPSQEIPRDVQVPLTAKQYAEGGVLAYLVEVAGRSILFVDTANFIESELVGIHPNVAVLASGMRAKVPDYACRLMKVLARPALVFPNHFDAHWQPLQGRQIPLSDEQRADLTSFGAEIHACAPSTKYVVPEGFRAIDVSVVR